MNKILHRRHICSGMKGTRIHHILYGLVWGICFGILFSFSTVQKATAQTPSYITIQGTVTDDSDNKGLSGATLTDSDKKVLGTTDEKGGFIVTVPSGTTINFSMLGHDPVSQTFSGSQAGVKIALSQSAQEINTVVVTALGITREERALGYAITKLDSTDFTDAVASNWTDALSGKAAGVNLVRNSGPAGSNKIILRGENNLTGDNEALIVIDGVVASSSSQRSATAGSVYAVDGEVAPADFGSAMDDLDPEDIESVTVLKGPAASALYG